MSRSGSHHDLRSVRHDPQDHHRHRCRRRRRARHRRRGCRRRDLRQREQPPKAGATAKHHHEAFRGEYAQWTTYDAKTKADVVHDGIKGSVSAVSPTSVTVKAKDGTSETFAVSSDTKVSVKGDAKGTAGSIGQVKVGDRVELVGTGKTSFTATHLRDHGAATAAPAPAS